MLVDLEGFIKIVDAVGGVAIKLTSRVPLVPNIDGKTKEAPYVGPGVVRMNGKMASRSCGPATPTPTTSG